MNQKVIYISIIAVIILLGGGLLLSTNNPEVSSTPENTNSPTPSSIPQTRQPVITTPQSNTKVISPLTVKGKVPPGWMFEGVFPIKLLDANRNVITQTQAKEVTPGSWSSGNDIEFSATINFTTNAKTGFIVLEKDNPSGLPENADSFEIPVNF